MFPQSLASPQTLVIYFIFPGMPYGILALLLAYMERRTSPRRASGYYPHLVIGVWSLIIPLILFPLQRLLPPLPAYIVMLLAALAYEGLAAWCQQERWVYKYKGTCLTDFLEVGMFTYCIIVLVPYCFYSLLLFAHMVPEDRAELTSLAGMFVSICLIALLLYLLMRSRPVPRS